MSGQSTARRPEAVEQLGDERSGALAAEPSGGRQRLATQLPSASVPGPVTLSLAPIFRTWWPLTASWLLIFAEGPILIAAVSRLPQPELNLAALGGIVIGVTLAIESPLLMLLTASATLSKDWGTFGRLRRYARWGIAALTLVHGVIAFTPAYRYIVTVLIGAPAELLEPGRLGLILTVPYLAAVADRRLHQGVLIRFGRSHMIIIGTLIRLCVDIGLLITAGMVGSITGVVAATATMTLGVWTEAIFVRLAVRPVLREQVRQAPAAGLVLTPGRFLRFYAPLAMTSVATFAMQPVTSAALSRLPEPIASLAAWPAVTSIALLLSSAGMALVEVVVTYLDVPRAFPALRRFAVMLSLATGLTTLVLVASPVGTALLRGSLALSAPLARMAQQAMWLTFLVPLAAVGQGLFQGVLAHARDTRPVIVAVMVSTLISLTVLGAGVAWRGAAGVYIAAGATTAAALVQALLMRLAGQRHLATESSSQST
jgi:hypothetical protein